MKEEGVEYLDLDDLLVLATSLLGDPAPIRDVGLLGAAAARPGTSAFGEDAYPDLWTKAAALLHSIVKNHPLVDGNKRLGWLHARCSSTSTASIPHQPPTMTSSNL